MYEWMDGDAVCIEPVKFIVVKKYRSDFNVFALHTNYHCHKHFLITVKI